MIKVYATTLALGFAGLLVVIFGGALSAIRRHHTSQDSGTMAFVSKTFLGGALGFSMGGLSAEYSPLDLTWQVSLLIALGGLVIGAAWVRYSLRQAVD